MQRLNRIQYSAAKLTTGALHFTNQNKLYNELGWESLLSRYKILGLSLFHKIHLHLTRPLIRNCLPEVSVNPHNTRSKSNYSHFTPMGVQFTKSFFPFFSRLWSSLDHVLKADQDLSLFKDKIKDKYKGPKYRHFNYGSKLGNKYLTHLRVGRSFLNAHRFVTGLSETPYCHCSQIESVEHYVLSCPLYNDERIRLFDRMLSILPKFNSFTKKQKIEILLNGIYLKNNFIDCRNIPITFAIQNYILSTKRFNKTS